MFDSGNINSHLIIKNFKIFHTNINKSFFQIFGDETYIDIETFIVEVNEDCNGSILEFNSLNVNYIYIYVYLYIYLCIIFKILHKFENL